MQLLINGRFLTQSVTGVQRYAIELVKAIDELMQQGVIDAAKYSAKLLVPRHAKTELNLKHIPVRPVGRLQGQLWEQCELPFYARGAPLFNPCNTAPLLKRDQVVTIHDAAVRAVPQGFSVAFRAWYGLLLPLLGKTVRKIVTVSDFSKAELVHYFHVLPSKCAVIAEGKEHIRGRERDVSVLERHRLNARPFILAVSSLNPNKNFAAIVKAVELMPDAHFDVVIAGGANPRVFSSAGMKLPAFVKHVGYVTDGELRVLYESAACFVYPSLYEGFGLPPLEAMACGCPVIVSTAASLPEVCGDAALYCDPLSPYDIATQIRLLMSDGWLREQMRKRGLIRAQQFSWSQCARETWRAIGEAVVV
jgi:glycosyltransferase involved in cell wall biosynthesis